MREDVISWYNYFMLIAEAVSKRSKDPSKQVGSCIVDDDNHILSTGYNGFPKGCSDKVFPWIKTSDDPTKNKYMYVVHSEMNAILNAHKDLRGSTIYVTLFPCNECAKAIIQAGIKKVIYKDFNPKSKDMNYASSHMFQAAGVEVEKYVPANLSFTFEV